MSDGNNNTPRRPLLAGGEHLAELTKRPQGGGPKYHPYSAEQAHAMLTPLAEALAHDLVAIPEKLSARHVVFEATLHPNYLASSYFPGALLEKSDLYVVGVRRARGVLKTKASETPDQPTKTILLAGSRESVAGFADMVVTGPARQKREWEAVSRFSEFVVPRPERVVRRLPADTGPGEVVTWEVVLNPIGRSRMERIAWGDEAFRKLVAWVGELGGEVDVDYRRQVQDVTFVPMALNVEAINEAARFNCTSSDLI